MRPAHFSFGIGRFVYQALCYLQTYRDKRGVSSPIKYRRIHKLEGQTALRFRSQELKNICQAINETMGTYAGRAVEKQPSRR